MRRTLRLQLEIPEIEMRDQFKGPLDPWMPTDQNALVFEVQAEKMRGTISLNVDPEGAHIDWEWDGMEPEVLEYTESCNQLVVVIDAECDDAVTETEFIHFARELAHRYVNRMLSYIRVELGQYWVSSIPIARWDHWYFRLRTRATWLHGRNETPAMFAEITEWPAVPPISEFDDGINALDRTVRDSIYHFIEEERDPDPQRELIANAKRHFANGDYRTAAVEAVAALEVALYGFTSKRCKERGISRKFKDVRGDLGAAAYLKLLLPLQISDEQLLCCRALIDRCDKLRRLRNDIVHEGKIPEGDDIENIKDGIEAVESLLSFLRDVEK